MLAPFVSPPLFSGFSFKTLYRDQGTAGPPSFASPVVSGSDPNSSVAMSSSWNYVKEVSSKFHLSGISPATPPAAPAISTAQQEAGLQALLTTLRDLASAMEDSEDSDGEGQPTSGGGNSSSGGISHEQLHQLRSQMIRTLDLIPSLLPVFEAHGWNGSVFEGLR